MYYVHLVISNNTTTLHQNRHNDICFDAQTLLPITEPSPSITVIFQCKIKWTSKTNFERAAGQLFHPSANVCAVCLSCQLKYHTVVYQKGSTRCTVSTVSGTKSRKWQWQTMIQHHCWMLLHPSTLHIMYPLYVTDNTVLLNCTVLILYSNICTTSVKWWWLTKLYQTMKIVLLEQNLSNWHILKPKIRNARALRELH